MKLGAKLLLTYCILLITVFVVTSITFKILLHRHLISEARMLLKTEAQAIANTLEKVQIFDKEIGSSLIAKRELRIAGQFIDSRIIIINKDKKILYTNLVGVDKKELQALIADNSLKHKEYVKERVPVLSKKGEIRGYVYLFTKIQDLNQINKLMNRTQLMSLVIGGVFAVLLVLIFQRGLVKPIQELKRYMINFSFRDNQPKLVINTGDEIEELASCFSAMIDKIRNYDIQQKRFLQNTSHELKTPLMSIQGYAEAIKDGVVEVNELEESLDIIIDESKRLKKIVDEMTYLIKLGNVEETFHFEASNLEEILRQSIRSVKALSDAKEVSIRIEGAFPYEGKFDNEKLARAFINILSNGIRYAEKEIIITCKEQDDFIEIHIIDDGNGFAAGEVDKVFERFYKGEKGVSGIGLSITKAIIAGHNGHIEAYNAVPKGAGFKIMLPKKNKNKSI